MSPSNVDPLAGAASLRVSRYALNRDRYLYGAILSARNGYVAQRRT